MQDTSSISGRRTLTTALRGTLLLFPTNGPGRPWVARANPPPMDTVSTSSCWYPFIYAGTVFQQPDRSGVQGGKLDGE